MEKNADCANSAANFPSKKKSQKTQAKPKQKTPHATVKNHLLPMY